ncbi:MAG: mannonate dehydratase [Chloroflexota bacterium]|nr:MAG: mannonate dehydratase [Chloroflexota bacterium]
MRVAVGQFQQATHEILTFAKQMGCSGVLLNTPSLPGERRWEYGDLRRLRQQVEGYGLRLEALENTPNRFYESAMLGLPDRDEAIENYCATIRAVGQAEIPILGFHWMPNSVWRSSRIAPGRGGALCTAFNAAEVDGDRLTHGRVYPEAEMWANYTYFLTAIVPVAEEAGVHLALHPDDPPVPSLGGVARLARSFDGFKKAMEVVPSPNLGLDFCMGCWSEMRGGAGVLDALEYFGSRGKIFYVHFRDVQGTAENFQECFLGEGNVNVVEAMRTLKKADFTGFFIDDHVPHMVDDTNWGHRGRALATGYIQGLLNAVMALG